MTATVLVADDEREIADVCRRYLEREGYTVLVAEDGERAMRMWDEHRPDLLVLDLMMPGKSGWEVCSAIRDEEDVPIIMLTARGEESDRLLGLTLGADDYLTKPFSPRELVLRVRNILRRSAPRPHEADHRRHQALESGNSSEDVRFEGLSLYPAQRRVTIRGEDVDLTAKEFDLLEWFVRHPGQVFSRSQLLSRVWDIAFEGDSTTVTVHMRRLREKIEPNPSEPTFLKTVWGIGYKFEGRTIE
ncbi:response regulator transcription factor [Cohnella nanjingensis]|uniref:Response regulator transcription factor n=1 Tax=Cohnella nanjingensis TaxID=1387779 RepID=A0A7X0RPB0_9BACL|nr:response regulator transcription factor [Cohnella nanjingensis]MBB6669915.1 response regulator transcription factor [Cohnella nanjingensis]